MEISIKWIATGIILFFNLSLALCYYPEYIVEDKCIIGNETILYETSKRGSVGILKATSHAPYKTNKHCKIILMPPADQSIVLSIRKIDLRVSGKYECGDYLKIYHSDVFRSPTTICHFKFDVEEQLSFFSRGPMTIIYHTEIPIDKRYSFEEGFSLTYTGVYQDIQDCVKDDNFMCDNGRCLSRDLTCDGHNNCGDRSDESPILCDNDSIPSLKMTDVIYMIIFTIVIFAIITTCAVVLAHKRARRSADTDSISDQDEPTARLTPYQAVHPNGFFICQNPAGPNTLYPTHSKIIQSEGGFSNPCYPTGIPQAPPQYSQ